MTTLSNVLNEQIRRLARREINANTRTTRRLTAHHRRDLAALKREVQSLTRRLAAMEKQASKTSRQVPTEPPEGARFSARSVQAQRKRLGLSARDFGKLIDVSPLTVYSWESGKSRPRAAQLARLVAVRGIGKREAMQRLGYAGGEGEEGEGQGQPRRRVRRPETAEQFILNRIASGKATTTAQINEAWSKSGRPGRADNTLSRMVKNRQIKREKLADDRGSKYRAA